MTDTYILKGHEPVPEPDLMAWAEWFAEADRQVADSIQDDVRVSTIFAGLSHGVSGRRPVGLFETMLFVNGVDQGCERYCTWDEAMAGHARWVQQVFKPTPILTLPTSGR